MVVVANGCDCYLGSPGIKASVFPRDFLASEAYNKIIVFVLCIESVVALFQGSLVWDKSLRTKQILLMSYVYSKTKQNVG